MFQIATIEIKFKMLLVQASNDCLNEIKGVTTDLLMIELIDLAQKRQFLDTLLYNRKELTGDNNESNL